MPIMQGIRQNISLLLMKGQVHDVLRNWAYFLCSQQTYRARNQARHIAAIDESVVDNQISRCPQQLGLLFLAHNRRYRARNQTRYMVPIGESIASNWAYFFHFDLYRHPYKVVLTQQLKLYTNDKGFFLVSPQSSDQYIQSFKPQVQKSRTKRNGKKYLYCWFPPSSLLAKNIHT